MPFAGVKTTCPPLGPVLPAPEAPSKFDGMEKVVRGLKAGLDEKTSSVARGITICSTLLKLDPSLILRLTTSLRWLGSSLLLL